MFQTDGMIAKRDEPAEEKKLWMKTRRLHENLLELQMLVQELR